MLLMMVLISLKKGFFRLSFVVLWIGFGVFFCTCIVRRYDSEKYSVILPSVLVFNYFKRKEVLFGATKYVV
jgi:hypothetical protein